MGAREDELAYWLRQATAELSDWLSGQRQTLTAQIRLTGTGFEISIDERVGPIERRFHLRRLLAYEDFLASMGNSLLYSVNAAIAEFERGRDAA